jgi:tetratricopeptide (TPR) repeat protein
MIRRYSLPLTWLLIALFSVNSGLSFSSQQAQAPRPTELRGDDPLSYAVVYARKSNNQSALSEIAIRYAELGDFERAMRVNESATDEDWRTGAFGKIALEYWRHGQQEKARELFLRVANLPLPKDVIYIWGDIIENMAEAQQFDLALDTDNVMAAAGGSTAGDELGKIVEEFVEAKTHNPSLPDVLPRVMAIAKTLPESNNTTVALKKVAVAYASQGQYDRATKVIQAFEEDFDREDGAQDSRGSICETWFVRSGSATCEQSGRLFRADCTHRNCVRSVEAPRQDESFGNSYANRLTHRKSNEGRGL